MDSKIQVNIKKVEIKNPRDPEEVKKLLSKLLKERLEHKISKLEKNNDNDKAELKYLAKYIK